jgi:hypothetical protein
VHGGRLAKVIDVDPDDGDVVILYADDGTWSGDLEPRVVAAAGPAQVAEGEAMLDALGAPPSSPPGRQPPPPSSPRAVWRNDLQLVPGRGESLWTVWSPSPPKAPVLGCCTPRAGKNVKPGDSWGTAR